MKTFLLSLCVLFSFPGSYYMLPTPQDSSQSLWSNCKKEVIKGNPWMYLWRETKVSILTHVERSSSPSNSVFLLVKMSGDNGLHSE